MNAGDIKAVSGPIRTERHGEILVVICDSPPVNALGAAVRQGIAAAIQQAAIDDTVEALVLRCDGRTFFAGADITEFGKPMIEPLLTDVVSALEASTKPVVAAIHGSALGGGCEVAIACHYRIAAASASLGTPEVKLGLLPGAGGTQRLPRLVGVKFALEMTAKGSPISAAKAKDAGLIDEVVADDSLGTEAVAFARRIMAVRPIPRASVRTAEADPAAVAAFIAANARRFRGFDAPAANIACVIKATETPFAEGLAFERAEFLKLMSGPQSAALRHIFFAERQAAKIDGLPVDTAIRQIARVGVIGAGTMGVGISMTFLSAGIPVTIVEMQPEALARGVASIRKLYVGSVSAGRMTAEAMEAALTLLNSTTDLADLADADLIIEAIYENLDAKIEVFRALDSIARVGAILASNTSYLDIDMIAACSGRPADVLGLHFFSPANIMKLLEVVRGAKTAPEVLATAMAVAKKIGKVAVVAGVTYGFIGNRMLRQRQVEAGKLLLEGASPEQIDRVHVEFGMPMGPFQMTDLAGVDIGWHRDPTRITDIREALNAEGRWGQKTQAGYYDYDDKRVATPSPRVAQIIDEWRTRTATQQHAVTDTEIIERTLYPLVNEGALILEERKAQRASDIDVVWVHGYGWPAYRGGPMFWARQEGLGKIAASLTKHGFSVARTFEP